MEFTDLFDNALCYEWFEHVVHGRDDIAEESLNDENQVDCPEEFTRALQSLKSPPMIRAAGPHMLRVLNEWLGANDDRLPVLVEPVVDSLSMQLETQLLWVMSTQDEVLGATRPRELLTSHFVTGVVFCLMSVFDVYQWNISPVAKLYWHWLSYLLQVKDDADVQKLISPMIISIILKPQYTAVQVRLSDLTHALRTKPLTLSAAFLNSEPGLEVIKKVLDTFASGYKDADQKSVFEFVTALTEQAVRISTDEAWSHVLYPLTASSDLLLVRPIITLANLVMRLVLPYLNQTKAKTRESQLASIKPLTALASRSPMLFLDNDNIRRFYKLRTDPSQSDDEGGGTREEQKSLKQVYATVTSPWHSFVCMTLCSLPERRDCRERACAILMECVKNVPPEFLKALLQVIRLLTSYHDRGTVRLAAIELLTGLSLRNDPSSTDIYDDLLRRSSDVSAIVRARTLELLAQVISGRPVTPASDESIVPEPPSPSPLILISESGKSTGETVTRMHPFDDRLRCMLHARLLDEKSVVRKGCISLVEVVFQREVIDGELTIVTRDILELLADDIIITIRQRFVTSLVAMLQYWLIGTGPGEAAAASLIFTQLVRLATDAEEVVYNKVVDAIDAIILPALQRALSEPDANLRNSTLYVTITSTEETIEWFSRALIRLLEVRYSENSPWSNSEFGSLVRVVCANPKGPSAVRLLNSLINSAHRALCKPATGAISGLLGSACLSIFEEIIPQLSGDAAIEHCSYALETLLHLAPLHVDAKNRKLIFDSLYQSLLDGAVHSTLVLKTALLTVTIMPKENASATCMAYLSGSKRQLSKFKITDPECPQNSNMHISPRILANACLLCGFASIVQLTLKCPKLTKFLQEMSKALTVTILSIGRYHEDKRVKAIALVAVSQVLLTDESLAKKHMGKLVQTAIMPNSSQSAKLRGVMANNLAFVTYDFSVCLTSVMDPYLTMVTSCIANTYPASTENRFSVLLLISQLAGLDFIKCKGLIMHHVIYALGDPCAEVSSLAYDILQTVLLPRLKDLILVYFAETVCFLTGYYDHPGTIRPFTFVHPLQRDVAKAYDDINVCAFASLDDRERRWQIYSKLLSLSQEQSKHLLTGKLIQDFIKPLISLEDELPVDCNSPCGLALADVLQIISSADMKLRFKSISPTSESVDGVPESSGNLESLAKVKYERELMASYMTQNVVPSLLALYHALRKKNSALQRNVIEAVGDILGELECDINDLINDKALRRRLEERINTQAHTCVDSIFNPLSEGSRKKLSCT